MAPACVGVRAEGRELAVAGTKDGSSCTALIARGSARSSAKGSANTPPTTSSDCSEGARRPFSIRPQQPDDLESSRKSTTNGDANAELGSGGAAAQSVDRPEEFETDSRNSASATNVEATTEAGARHPKLMPLDFLLSVMRHPKTPVPLRIKVALATQPYIHPRKSNRRPTPVATAIDRHGFEVEPALAKKLRNEIARLRQLKRRRNPRPKDQKTARKLRQKIEAKIATLRCE